MYEQWVLVTPKAHSPDYNGWPVGEGAETPLPLFSPREATAPPVLMVLKRRTASVAGERLGLRYHVVQASRVVDALPQLACEVLRPRADGVRYLAKALDYGGQSLLKSVKSLS